MLSSETFLVVASLNLVFLTGVFALASAPDQALRRVGYPPEIADQFGRRKAYWIAAFLSLFNVIAAIIASPIFGSEQGTAVFAALSTLTVVAIVLNFLLAASDALDIRRLDTAGICEELWRRQAKIGDSVPNTSAALPIAATNFASLAVNRLRCGEDTGWDESLSYLARVLVDWSNRLALDSIAAAQLEVFQLLDSLEEETKERGVSPRLAFVGFCSQLGRSIAGKLLAFTCGRRLAEFLGKEPNASIAYQALLALHDLTTDLSQRGLSSASQAIVSSINGSGPRLSDPSFRAALLNFGMLVWNSSVMLGDTAAADAGIELIASIGSHSLTVRDMSGVEQAVAKLVDCGRICLGGNGDGAVFELVNRRFERLTIEAKRAKLFSTALVMEQLFKQARIEEGRQRTWPL